MKTTLQLAVLVLVVTAFYDYVGHWVPQKEVHPPQERDLSGTLTTDEMIAAGEAIASGKGTCMSCHTLRSGVAGRFPDLAGIGARAGRRRPGMSGLEYLAESLYEPDAFIVAGFNPGMTPAHKPPIGLDDREILTVLAYLQSLGGTPSVTMQTRLKYHGAAPVAVASAADDPETLLKTYCAACHALDRPDRRVGPSLFELGARMTRPQIYEAILDPDATIADGFPPGLMPATLQSSGFYDKVSSAQMKAVVAALVAPRATP